MPNITLRSARPDEANALTRPMVRAKASHGYDAETMAAFAPALILTATHIACDWVHVACAERDGAPSASPTSSAATTPPSPGWRTSSSTPTPRARA